MSAPVASGWSGRRVGLAPTGKSAALSRRTWKSGHDQGPEERTPGRDYAGNPW
jgi:hypothetical protein